MSHDEQVRLAKSVGRKCLPVFVLTLVHLLLLGLLLVSVWVVFSVVGFGSPATSRTVEEVGLWVLAFPIMAAEANGFHVPGVFWLLNSVMYAAMWCAAWQVFRWLFRRKEGEPGGVSRRLR